MAVLPRPKLDSLTGLRFFLAIFVFFYHGVPQAHLGLGKNSLSADLITFIDYTSNGGLAVGCFFMLSGFVLWYSYSGRNWTFPQFIGNRIARLFPVYLLGILMVLPRWQNLLNEFSVGTGEGLQRLLLSVLMLQSWTTDLRATQMFNGPGWTLSAEMFFYLTFPFFFAIHQRSRRFFLVSCSLVSGFTLIYPWFGDASWIPVCARHWGLFTLGLLLCESWQRGLRVSIGLLPATLILVFGYQLARWVDPQLVIHVVAVLVLGSLATADATGKSLSLFSNRWCVLGGEISYAIYILHVPIQTIVYSLFFRSGIFLRETDNFPLKLTYLSICFVVTLTASYLAWRFIEVPARKTFLKWLQKRTA